MYFWNADRICCKILSTIENIFKILVLIPKCYITLIIESPKTWNLTYLAILIII